MVGRSACIGGFLLLLLCVGCGAPPEPSLRVVLITLDTLRHDAFAGSAGRSTAMPRSWERSRQATRFSRAYAASTTTQPTHASLFTGLHPWQHGVTRNGQVLDASHETLAERLREAGFATIAVVGSYPVSADFGFGQGFASYREEFTTGLGGARVWEGHPLPDARFFSRADTVTDRAIAALDAADAPRVFLWVHYFDPHSPYGSTSGGTLMEGDVVARVSGGEPRDAVLAEVRQRYADDVAWLDLHLDRLLARLAQDAEDVPTHVLLTADHGESLGEGGAIGHGYGLPDVEIHVPTWLFSPALPQRVRDDPVGTVDLATTLLALAGALDPAGGGFGEGRDLRVAPPPAPVVGMRRTFRNTGVGERRLDGSVRPIPDLLFYALDPSGRTWRGNGRRVAGRDRDREDAILARFRAYEQQLLERAPSGALDPEVEARLRALGYAP